VGGDSKYCDFRKGRGIEGVAVRAGAIFFFSLNVSTHGVCNGSGWIFLGKESPERSSHTFHRSIISHSNLWIIPPIPAPSPPEVLHLCLRRLEHNEPIQQVAIDARLSIQTIQRAKASDLHYGSVFPPQNSGGRPKRIDNDVMNVSSILLIGIRRCRS